MTDQEKGGFSSVGNIPSPSPAGIAGEMVAKQKPKKRQKRFRSKKPKDMPPRPLSAYNLFFKDERVRLLNDANSDDKKMGFESMAKTVGQRWKQIDPKDLERYKALAKEQMANYRKQMDEYHLTVAKRARIEKEEAAASAKETEKLRQQVMKGEELQMMGQNPSSADMLRAQMMQQQQQQQHQQTQGMMFGNMLYPQGPSPALYSMMPAYQQQFGQEAPATQAISLQLSEQLQQQQQQLQTLQQQQLLMQMQGMQQAQQVNTQEEGFPGPLGQDLQHQTQQYDNQGSRGEFFR